MKYIDLKKELSHKERTIKDLVSYLDTRMSNSTPNYNVLLGAGASVNSGIRSGQNLVNEWREDIYSLLSEKEDTPKDYTEEVAKTYLMTREGNWYSESNEYSSLFEKKFDLPSQRRRFVEKEVDNASPSIGYAYLTSLVDSPDRYIDTIFTTNFDDLINEAFYQFSQTRPIVCAHDSSIRSLGLSSSRPKIIKLHGDYLFDDIKSTLRETESLELNIKNKFIEFSKDFGLIVVGYAGHDRSIMDVINHLLKSDEYFKNGIYWCIREGDFISSELRKLLWKDGVYFVLIDGFDELFAEIHHKTKGSLSIKDKLSESKRDKILSIFTNDDRGLSKSSQYIAEDLDGFKKHKNESDISDMIRELRDIDDEEISEDILKIFLKIDTLIKIKDFEKAKKFAENSIDPSMRVNIKSHILRKIIYICEQLSLIDEAHLFCDKLIGLDEFNYEYHVVKSNLYKSTNDICDYINKKIGIFKNSVKYNNYAAINFIKKLSESDNVKITDIQISSLLNTSLKLDPSLNNKAWNISLDLICEKYKNKNDKKSRERRKIETNDIIDKAKKINDTHVTYFQLIDHIAYHNNNLEQKLTNIKIYNDSFQYSFLSKKSYLYNLICSTYLSFSSEVNKEFSYVSEISKFINNERYKTYDQKDELSSFYLLQATVSLNENQDMNKYRNLIIKASDCLDAKDNISNILSAFLEQLKDSKLAFDFISNIKNDISEIRYQRAMSDIDIFNGKYTEALKRLDKVYAIDNNFKPYAQSKSFCLIKSEDYQATVDFVNENIDMINKEDASTICKINKQAALKLQGKPVDKVEIRNIINKNEGSSETLACYCLLGEDGNIKRIIKESITYNRETIEMYKYWPVIDNEYIAKYTEGSNVFLVA